MKDPAFLFYPNDYIGGTMGMTFEQKGAYMELLMTQFSRGHMTYDMIAHVLGQGHAQLWDLIQDKFLKDEKGLYYNERLEYEQNKRKSYTASRKNNKKGNNQYTTEGGHMTSDMSNHMTEHMGNGNRNRNKEEKEESTERGKGRKEDYLEIVEMWNATCGDYYPKLLKLSDARKTKLRIRLSEMGSVDILKSIFEKMAASKFLQGDNNKGWRASFDWILENDKNWVKILEGNYDAKPNSRPTPVQQPKTLADYQNQDYSGRF